ncbi:MAG: purine-nucleoside phosphorylase [Solobacterium sp.]|nr:purine-nucleoside phosphorylase [Solobacterium sp.]MCH4222911.1 purine-nucleoside phosphorylase [Solobacterium sp.]
MSTPHNAAEKGQFAKTVLMPGDPLRAKFIADTFLKDPKLVTSVRNVYGYTGDWNGKQVSVMASGMGIPSIGIYSYELFKFYGVENIIRIGSAGAYTRDLHVYDVVLCTGAYSESSYAFVQSGDKRHVLTPSEELNQRIKDAAGSLNVPLHEGIVHSSDVFYREDNKYLAEVTEVQHCIAVDMESFGLFNNANVLHKHAACLLTISDSFVYPDEITTPEEREQSFTNMMKVALDAAE